MILFLAILIVILIWFSQQIFGRFDWYRKLSCKIGWHSHPNFENIHKKTDDPLQFLTFAKCKWCGYDGQIDSQGNLF